MENDNPRSIYALARAASRPYRRVHDHVHALAKLGLVTLEETRRQNRRTLLVISNDPCYQRLLRLDDLFDARQEIV